MSRIFILTALFTVTLLFSPSIFSHAQDIILTRDNQIIRAKVQTIRESEVVYKLEDNIAGPDYILSSAKISKIVFPNGQEYIPSNESDKINDDPEMQNKPLADYEVKLKGPFVFRPMVGDRELTEDEQRFFLGDDYDEFIKYYKRAGSGTFGLIPGTIGAILLIDGIINLLNQKGPAMLYTSLGFLSAAAPFIIVGSINQNKANNLLAKHSVNHASRSIQMSPTIFLTTGGGALGLNFALKF